MELVLALLVGWLAACGVFLMLRRDLIRFMLGFVVLSNAVNLLLLLSGRVTRAAPPLIPSGETQMSLAAANPLPQALLLTAIVIGFGLLAFGLVLVYRVYVDLGFVNPDRLVMSPEVGEEGLE